MFKRYYLNLVVVFNVFNGIFHVTTRGRVLFSGAYLHSWRVSVVPNDCQQFDLTRQTGWVLLAYRRKQSWLLNRSVLVSTISIDGR